MVGREAERFDAYFPERVSATSLAKPTATG